MVDGIKRYVIDASVALAFLLPDEVYKDKTRKLFSEDSAGKLKLIAPLLLYYEITNGLKTAILRKRMSLQRGKQLLEQFVKLRIAVMGRDKGFDETLKLAVEHNISDYDAVYVVLAKNEKCQLLTADEKLFNHIERKFSPIVLLTDLKL